MDDETLDRLCRRAAAAAASIAAAYAADDRNPFLVASEDSAAVHFGEVPATVDQAGPAGPQVDITVEQLRELVVVVAPDGRYAFSDIPVQTLHLGIEPEMPGPREVPAGGGAHWSEQLERLIQDLSPDLDIPTPAEVLQGRRNAEARAQLLTEFGGMTSSQVADFVGSEARNRASAAHRLKKDGRLLGVTYKGTTWYPGFQFHDGDVLPVVADVLAEFDGAGLNEWETALWFTTSNGWLDDQRPVDLLVEQPAAVVEAARLEVSGFGG